MKKSYLKNVKNNEGITLIALAVTIIIMLVLAVVTITVSVGDNGLLQRARLLRNTNNSAEEQEYIKNTLTGIKVNKKIAKDNTTVSGTELKTELQKNPRFKNIDVDESDTSILLTNQNNKYIVDKDTYNVEPFTGNLIPEDLKVGDTIIYDPTKGVTDTSKLTYTSVKGTAKTGGNGYGTQTVTAKANNNEWVVISKAGNQLKVMSKEPVGGVTGGKEANKFTLEGGIGWLYAEEELHKACSIYGHGKGAKQITTSYQIGNKYVGEAQMRTLIGSGARSMTMVDIVQIMKGNSYTDFTEEEKKLFDPDYMNPSQKSSEVYYPTISSVQENGTSTAKQRYEYDYYDIDENGEYDKDLVEDEKVKENKRKLKVHIYKNDQYWLSSRSVYISGNAYFCVYSVYLEYVSIDAVLNAEWNGSFDGAPHANFLRPVVYLDGNMIEKQTQGVWKIKD
ncbi:MAG: hypothetical protein ACTTGJ_02575 [Clostridium sp.]